MRTIANEKIVFHWKTKDVSLFAKIAASKKKKKERETHNVSKNTTCQMHTNYAQRKRKIT